MLKRLLLIIFLAIIGYYLLGFTLLYFGKIKSLPVFFNKVLKASSNEGTIDLSKASADGPYVFYMDSLVVVKNLREYRSVITLDSAIYKKNDSMRLSCQVEEDSFGFRLKPVLAIENCVYQAPSKLFAISDIEGHFKAFRTVLQGNNIIDSALNWSFGDGHLVLLGDFFDRGLYVTETLWLIYKLEAEAEKKGGKVHFILGNHEMMNLYGNDKYVRKKYKENLSYLNESHTSLFSSETEIGRWLRTKNVIEKIGSTIFVHGGISVEIAESGLSLQEINHLARQNIGIRPDAVKGKQAGLVTSGKTGPYWYRGLVNEEVDKNEMDAILRFADARRIVVGHTLVDDIRLLYGGKVIAIDLHHEDNFKKGIMKALWMENEKVFLTDIEGKKRPLP